MRLAESVGKPILFSNRIRFLLESCLLPNVNGIPCSFDHPFSLSLSLSLTHLLSLLLTVCLEYEHVTTHVANGCCCNVLNDSAACRLTSALELHVDHIFSFIMLRCLYKSATVGAVLFEVCQIRCCCSCCSVINDGLHLNFMCSALSESNSECCEVSRVQ